MTDNLIATTDNRSGAKAALAGYDYQVDVSVFAALQMLLIENSASRLVLEPANAEDLEVDLIDTGPGRVEASAVTNDSKLVIQVKFSSGEPWSVADIITLMEHGARRRPAREHLNDPSIRYMLITSASLKGVARGLAVKSFMEPPTGKMPPELNGILPANSEGRVWVWAGLTQELLDYRINDILGGLLKVEPGKKAECREKLRQEAKTRMAGSAPGVWTRADLLSIVRPFGGRLASSAALETFIPPSNFSQMLALLKKRNAIVICGPSGSGKTIAALALRERALELSSGMDTVNLASNSDPSAARVLAHTGPRLIYIEDPWGSYELENGALTWTEQLPRLLSQARPDHQFIVTSRTDILSEAKGLEALSEWTVQLDGTCYQTGELARIYEKRTDRLPRHLQRQAFEFQKEALDELDTPFELDRFFRELEKGPKAGEVSTAFFRRIVALAHRDAVRDVVVKYLKSTTDTGLATIIWALLRARGNFDRRQLAELHRQLRRTGRGQQGLDRLVDRLVATGHLRQPGSTVIDVARCYNSDRRNDGDYCGLGARHAHHGISKRYGTVPQCSFDGLSSSPGFSATRHALAVLPSFARNGKVPYKKLVKG